MPGVRLGVMFSPDDVPVKQNPFFDIIAQLHKPTRLTGNRRGILEAIFPFGLTPSQVEDISSSKEYMVQLSFCSVRQEGYFPRSVVVRMNGEVVPVPDSILGLGVEPKRPSRPLNVTNYVKLSPTVTNQLNITWSSDISGEQYAMSLHLVKRLCAQTLVNRIVEKGSRPRDMTIGLLKNICKVEDPDCSVATTSLKVSLDCPLGKCRMTWPCRGNVCAHVQCFDANFFLQMNERKPTWICPVCDKPLAFESLGIDDYFDEIIKNVTCGSGNDVVEIFPDGTWRVDTNTKRQTSDFLPPAKKMTGNVCDQVDMATSSSAASVSPYFNVIMGFLRNQNSASSDAMQLTPPSH